MISRKIAGIPTETVLPITQTLARGDGVILSWLLSTIFGRTENPQGKLYENKPRIEKIRPEMEQFITMCFEPGSTMNERLKETLLQMLKEGTE